MDNEEAKERAAVEVMGWHLSLGEWFDADDDIQMFVNGATEDPDVWDPMHNIAHAFMVVDKMLSDGWQFKMNVNGAGCEATFTKYKPDQPSFSWCGMDLSDSVGSSITLAALKAKESKRGPS